MTTRKRKPIRKKFVVPIYDALVHVIAINTSLADEYERVICRDKFWKGISDNTDALTVTDEKEGEYYLIFRQGEYDLNDIGHELFHLTIKLLHDRDIQFNLTNQEPFAYLQGYLTERVMMALGIAQPNGQAKEDLKDDTEPGTNNDSKTGERGNNDTN